jgi:hypothetical protein
LDRLQTLLSANITRDVYEDLVVCVLARIILFNAKRGGETGRMLINDFNNIIETPNKHKEFNLSPLEIQLSTR